MHEDEGLKTEGRIGMWLFICTEIILFGGLFLLYAVYRMKNPADFHNAAQGQSRFLGTLNTSILITSSFFVALALFFQQEKKIKTARLLLLGTIMSGLAFLGIKASEWSEKIVHGIYPAAPYLMSRPRGEILYHGLYYLMTGLHALHVIAGTCIFCVVYIRLRREDMSRRFSAFFTNSGLYWHLVDIIWIFLFPLFYLIA